MSALWHCRVAAGWVTFLSDRTACEESTAVDRLSSTGRLARVQKTLPRVHDVRQVIWVSDPTSMYTSLGKTVQVSSGGPLGTRCGWNHWGLEEKETYLLC